MVLIGRYGILVHIQKKKKNTSFKYLSLIFSSGTEKAFKNLIDLEQAAILVVQRVLTIICTFYII